jgi:nitrite reductase/ring-hydroxylating ferredoxin subunit
LGSRSSRLGGKARATWSTQDYISQDGLPYVGSTWSLPDRVQVATGFAKWGMTTGTAAGRLMAAKVLSEEVAWSGAFDAGRFGTARSVSRLVRLNAEVARRFIVDRVPSLSVSSPEEDGDGVVIRDGWRPVARARFDGRTCDVSGVCPHLGGVVAWNPAERSWDCPLHGSRFESDGRLLQGPSVRDLDPR